MRCLNPSEFFWNLTDSQQSSESLDEAAVNVYLVVIQLAESDVWWDRESK